MKRSPISKISKKHRVKLAGLARVRRDWWLKAEKDGVPLMCGICVKPIQYFYELASDHITPGKMGGCRSDEPMNLQPAHKLCNYLKSSKRNYVHPSLRG